MQRLIYYLVYPLLWLISKLPWKLFYLLSDFVYFLTYYVIRYRRAIVAANLQLAFPEMKAEESLRVQRQFYQHLCDMFFEMIRSMSITAEEMLQRFKITNPEALRTLENNGESVLVMFGHFASYEWSNSINLNSSFQCVGVYKRLRNPYFDQLLQKIRARFDSPLIESHQVFRQITKDKQEGRKRIYGMISDQTPKLQNALYWTSFMGVTVPVFMGTEILAKRLDLPVYYMKIDKVKRGFYEAEFIPIEPIPKTAAPYQIVERYFELLEAQIRQKPEHYLWTHKRWKLKNAVKPEGAVVSEKKKNNVSG